MIKEQNASCDIVAAKDNESVLSCYCIDEDDISDMSINDIWTDFVISDVRVRCSNVYHFDLPITDVLAWLKSSDFKSSEFSSKLLSDIKREYENGATVMFVQPVVGNPIDGFVLRKFLSN